MATSTDIELKMQAAKTFQRKIKNIYSQKSFTHNKQHPLTPPKAPIRILFTPT